VKKSGFKPLILKVNTTKRGSELESLLHSEHTIEIEKLVVGGDGLGRLTFKEKSLVVFVPMAAPGDKLKIKIIKAEKNHLKGEILQIIKPAESRRPAPCEYYESCGGCSLQHMTESAQLAQKELILRDLLNRFIPNAKWELLPAVKSEFDFHYRNRIQLKAEGGKLGYFKKSSHQIVDISHCPIADKRISDSIPSVKSELTPSPEVVRYELRINHLEQFEYYKIGEDGEGLSFSQVNNSVNNKLVKAVESLVSAINPVFVSELYAGAGNFSFPIMAKLPTIKMESVELNPKLTEFAVKKLTGLNLQNHLTFVTSDCESFVKRGELSKELVVLDPPRAGCSEDVMSAVCKRQPANIVYISCHPANLARDMSLILQKNPSYKIKYLQIFDMFPQTDHFETLVHLSK
jgi:23S rRNA (uracil1939-C5)-methyltransferase